MLALEACHAQGYLHKAMGGCNDAKRAVTLCLRGERVTRTTRNREKAVEKRRATRELFEEIDANS